jgi:hypothetical protein
MTIDPLFSTTDSILTQTEPERLTCVELFEQQAFCKFVARGFYGARTSSALRAFGSAGNNPNRPHPIRVYSFYLPRLRSHEDLPVNLSIIFKT